MSYSAFSLLPPLVVLIVGFLTRRVLLSLLSGIITAALVSSHFDLVDAAVLIFTRLWKNFELYNLISFSSFWQSRNLFICMFLLFLGCIISLVNFSGGAYAYGTFMQKRLKNSKNTQTASLALSLILFVDDYFSSLTVGNVMTPLTDRFRIPRAKLAFLVDSMAAPLAILCPFSSWFAAIIGFLTENGISLDKGDSTLIFGSTFEIYLKTIPFIFYSIIIIICSFYIVRRNISFGSMKQHEDIAQETGNLFGGDLEYQQRLETSKKEVKSHLENTSMADFFVPIGAFIICIIFGMVFSGGYNPMQGEVSFFTALQNSSVSISLFTGGGAALVFVTLYFFARRKITLYSSALLFWDSAKMMFQTMLILMFAWTLGEILRNDLSIGNYLASLIGDNVHISLLPALFFIISLMIAFATGTSWGTAAVMLPIAIPTIISLFKLPIPAQMEQMQILYPVLGGIFSGCIAGDHLSPISDTTIMSSISTKMPHIDHVQTQMGYALPLVAVTIIGFVVSGFLIQYGNFISILSGSMISLLLAFILLELLNKQTSPGKAASGLYEAVKK
jgi:tetracycline resistance efflux pump